MMYIYPLDVYGYRVGLFPYTSTSLSKRKSYTRAPSRKNIVYRRVIRIHPILYAIYKCVLYIDIFFSDLRLFAYMSHTSARWVAKMPYITA